MRRLLSVGVFVVFVSACGGSGSSPATPTSPTLTPTLSPPTATAPATDLTIDGIDGPDEVWSTRAATRQAIHKCSKVFAKLDPAEHPRYSDSFFREPDGRQDLTTAVQAVLESLLNGTSVADWGPGILAIRDNPGRYFDVTRTPNDAQADFARDWEKVVVAAGLCGDRKCFGI